MKIVAIMPGRFHPFHKGHAASFKQLAGKFGMPNTLLAISAKQEQPNSPFAAADRAKMAQALGIPAKNILIVRNPYSSLEYADHLQSKGIDPTKTALVFGVSGKDMNEDARFSFKPTKNGQPSYMQPFTKEATLNLQPMTKGTPGTGHAYVMTTDVQEFPIAGKTMRDASAIRKAYAGANDRTKLRILTDLYGDAAQHMKQTFDNNLQITESVKELVNKIKPLLSEATLEQKAKFFELLSEAKKTLKNTNPCWKGYKPVGTRKKNGKTVPNCVPNESVEEAANAAQQAAIAINMKKHHKKPKNEDVMESLGDGFYLINGSEIRFLPEEKHDGGNIVSDDEFEKLYTHPEFHKTAAFARTHYPSAPSKQQAFLRFVMRSLMHSEEDDKRQDKEINLLMKRVNTLQDQVDSKKTPEAPAPKVVAQKSEKVDESVDYLEEK
jgi:hypothetical protein